MIYGNKTVQFSVYNRDSGTPAFVQDTTSVTLPNMEYLTDTISGAGIGGEIDMPTLAQLGPMTLEMALRRSNVQATSLLAPGSHEVEVRWVTDVVDSTTGAVRTVGAKHICKGFSKSLEGGTLENNASQEANVILEVVYDKYIIDGETVWEVDKLNNVLVVNGVDYGQQIRDNL